jgi:hypothetical protein
MYVLNYFESATKGFLAYKMAIVSITVISEKSNEINLFRKALESFFLPE